jgi:signal transduction histidine kinase
VEQNGGRLEISSRPGGTTVIIRLPATVPVEAVV